MKMALFRWQLCRRRSCTWPSCGGRPASRGSTCRTPSWTWRWGAVGCWLQQSHLHCHCRSLYCKLNQMIVFWLASTHIAQILSEKNPHVSFCSRYHVQPTGSFINKFNLLLKLRILFHIWVLHYFFRSNRISSFYIVSKCNK